MFAAPLFLIAAAVGAMVPLLLHAIQNKRRITMPFPTVRFLKMADKQSSRRARMEYLLLWLIRTAIMVLLGLAFAMPTLRLRRMAWLGDSPRDIAIVIDASYSMGYRKDRQAVWELAKETAADLVEGLGDSDRFCLYVAGEQPVPIIAEPVSDTEEGLAQIKALEIRRSSSNLAPALQAALDALQQQSQGREKEIYILTDNQALPWQGFNREGKGDEEASSGSWDPSSVDRQTAIFTVLLGVPDPENTGMMQATLDPPVLFGKGAAQLTAELTRSGPPESTTVILSIDDTEVGRRSFQAGGSEGDAPLFPIPPLEPGIHAGRLETPEDNLEVDNTFHFLIQVKENLPTLCVGTKEDTLFVRAALKAGQKNGIQYKWITVDKVADEPLHPYAAVILCNALPLPGQALGELESYVKAGGLVALFPGSGAAIEDYRALPWLPGHPSGIREPGLGRRSRTLNWDQPQHPLVRPLRAGLNAPTMAIRRHLAWEKLEDQTERLISAGAGEPFLFDRPYGRGRVLMGSTAVDRSWSEFPLSPFFLPVIHQIVEYGSGIGGVPPYVWGENSLSLGSILPQVTRESSLAGPDSRPVPIRSTIVEGRTVLHAENATEPGIYTLSQPGAPDPVPALAINMLRKESDLTPLPPNEVLELIGTENLHLAEDREALLQLIEEHRVGRTFGEHLLWLALLLIIVEFFYANRLLKGGTSLTQKLDIDPSGKVGGTAA